MTAPRRWLVVVIALLGVHMTAVGVLIVQSRGLAPRLMPDAYRRAMEHDQTLAALAASAERGWRADARLASIDATHDRVVIELTDGHGAAIAGAQVQVSVRHASRATGTTVVLEEEGAGRYSAAVTAQGVGVNVVDVLARRGGDHFAAARTVTRAEAAP